MYYLNSPNVKISRERVENAVLQKIRGCLTCLYVNTSCCCCSNKTRKWHRNFQISELGVSDPCVAFIVSIMVSNKQYSLVQTTWDCQVILSNQIYCVMYSFVHILKIWIFLNFYFRGKGTYHCEWKCLQNLKTLSVFVYTICLIICLFVYEMLIPVRVMETELSPRLLEAEQW